MSLFEASDPKARLAKLRAMDDAERTEEVQRELSAGSSLPPYPILTVRGVARVEARIETLDGRIQFTKHNKNESFELSGDGYHDNPGFRTLKAEEEALIADKARLLMLLRDAIVIDPSLASPDVISVGTTVALAAVSGNETSSFQIVGLEGSGEDDDDEDLDEGLVTVSYETPLARRLIGRRVGEQVDLGFGGREAPFVVQSIEAN